MRQLTLQEATKLSEIQFKLDRSEFWARAFTTVCVPVDVAAEDVESWRKAEREKMLSPVLAERAALLEEFGWTLTEWENHLKLVKALVEMNF